MNDLLNYIWFSAQCTAREVLSEFGSFLWGSFGIRGRCHICHQMDLHFHNLRVNDRFRHDSFFWGRRLGVLC
jgi:hypothetical protein